MTDPDSLHAPAYVLANALSFLADATLVVAVFALTRPWGTRLPNWLFGTTMWIATGLLAPIVVVVPLATPFVETSGVGGAGDLRAWVYYVVYGCFIAEAVLLAWLLTPHVQGRWWGTSRDRNATRPVPFQVARATAVLCTAIGIVLTIWSFRPSAGLGSLAKHQSDIDRITLGASAFFAFLTAWALTALTAVRSSSRTTRFAICALWIGTSAMTTWGLYSLTLYWWRPQLGAAALIVVTTAKSAAGLAAAGWATRRRTITQTHSPIRPPRG